MNYSFEAKIPKERIAVLIGASGSVKAEIEEHTQSKLDIDSEEGDVKITGDDPVLLYTAREVVKSVGRGFNPNVALLLLKMDYTYETISMEDYAKTKNGLIRLKGRVIGKEGKSRKTIEELTDTYICVYGKTIGIIGPVERTPMARKAVQMLLEGSRHGNVYNWIERQRRKFRLTDMMPA